MSPVAEFINSDGGDKINSGIGLSYRPDRLHGLAGRYENSTPEFTLSPSHGCMNSATVVLLETTFRTYKIATPA